MPLFESYERRIDKINSVLNSYGIASIEEAEKICKDAGLDVYEQVKKIQPIAFENACWSYIVGAAIAIKKDRITSYNVCYTKLLRGFRRSPCRHPPSPTRHWRTSTERKRYLRILSKLILLAKSKVRRDLLFSAERAEEVVELFKNF